MQASHYSSSTTVQTLDDTTHTRQTSWKESPCTPARPFPLHADTIAVFNAPSFDDEREATIMLHGCRR
ncbi:hypothetical protein DCC24_07150 [Auritidibacter sp. NML100628]|nr:hypothetical protein DCC24_07150 [Auritidibacter sp. NML100628]